MKEVKLEVIVDRDLKPLNSAQQKIVDSFTKYKELSLNSSENNFITPPIGVQRTTPSDHLSYGRDTEFEFPTHLINDIFEYNLSKVHIDTKASWKPLTNQWYCKSNESLVYSGFKMPNGDLKLVVIAILISASTTEDFDAHKRYKTKDIDVFLDIAHENREEVLAKDK